MTSFVFPTNIDGVKFDNKRGVSWKSREAASSAMMVSNLPLQQYPVYTWEYSYEILRHDVAVSGLAQLAGLLNACAGSYDTFLYTDPLNNTVTLESFGTGDGTTKAFQLGMIYKNAGGDGRGEIIQNLNGAPQIYVAGVLKTVGPDYALGPTGIVTFQTAPANAAALTWSGAWFYRCRFIGDTFEATEFMSRWWEARSIKFKSEKL